MAQKEDWHLWYEEQSIFANRNTQGFSKDLEALEQHIKNLIAVCPKDKAGWPVSLALIAIGRLQKNHANFKEYLALDRQRK